MHNEQDPEQSETENKLSNMAQLGIKVESETYSSYGSPHVYDNQQTDTFASSNHDSYFKNLLHSKFNIKPDPDSEIDDTQVCVSTSQSLDDVAMHIKEEPAAYVGYNEPSPLSVNLLMTRLHLIGPCAGYVRLANIMWPANPAVQQECLHCCIPVCWQTKSGLNLLQTPLKLEVEGSVAHLEESSDESDDLSKRSESKSPIELKVVPSRLSSDDVCVSGNSDCTRQVNVKEHAKCTTSGNTYQCDVCHKSFKGRTNIQKHIRTHTDRPYKCSTCNKSFKQSRYLREHSRSHTGDRPYKCDICNKVFTFSNNLKRHLSIHSEEKMFQCDICKKSFRRSCHLKLHILTHTGKKPYKCNLCSMAYGNPNNLRTHIRTHTGVLPYKCETCDKAFNNPGNLRTHIRTHTGDKPYKCDVCNAMFSHSSTLTIHMRSHTGERPYKCDFCDKSYPQLGAIKYHLSRTH